MINHLVRCLSLGEVEGKRVTIQEEHSFSGHILVTLMSSQPVGYLRFVVQQMREDEGRQLVKHNRQVLEEAEGNTFAVVSDSLYFIKPSRRVR